MKTYTIIQYHRDREREIKGTLPELIKYFSYTLECGHSWEYQKGCKKVNTQPKTIRALLTALSNAVHNTQGSCYNPDFYTLKEE